MLSKLAVKRLTKLCEFMEKLPKAAIDHFDMGLFFGHRPGAHEIDHGIVNVKRLMDCGTTACALGWAASVPSFRRSGLEMTIFKNGAHRFRVNKRTMPSVEAGLKFFNLTNDDGCFFFDAHRSIRTPKDWAERARRFIRNNSQA